MRENVRGEERDTTTHLIKIHVFTHASRVTKFSSLIFKLELRKRQTQWLGRPLHSYPPHLR